MAIQLRVALACALALLLAACSRAVPFNQILEKGSHNSYQRDEGLKDQLNFHRVRSIELDAHIGRVGCTSPGNPVDGDWYVYHVCLADDSSNVRMLSDGLKEIRAFHDANPQHEAITLFMDLKDDCDAGTHSPAALDALLGNALGAALYTPADLLSQASTPASTLRAAVTGANSWPDTAALRGRILVIITSGQGSYATTDAVANARKAFVSYNGATAMPAAGFYVFINQDGTDAAQSAFSATVYASGLMSRQYYSESASLSRSAWDRSVANKANFIAHNLVNYYVDPYYVTHDPVTGFPARTYVGSFAGVYETQTLFTIYVTSEDVWGSSDNCVFMYTRNTGAWTAEISTVNSHAPQNWAKGGIMFRESTAANARYFAVVRGADANVLRYQIRSSVGGSTSNVNAGVIPPSGVDPQLRDLVKVSCTYAAPNTVCGAYGSGDGASWYQIGGTQTFAGVNLVLSGPFASSHGNVLMQDGTQTKFVFTNLKQGGVTVFPSGLKQANIGTVYRSPLIRSTVF